MASLQSRQPVIVRVSRGGVIYQADVRMEGDDIVCSQTDISDVAGELEYRDSVFRRVCHDLRAPLHGIAGLAEDLIIKAKRAAASTETAEASSVSICTHPHWSPNLNVLSSALVWIAVGRPRRTLPLTYSRETACCECPQFLLTFARILVFFCFVFWMTSKRPFYIADKD